MYWFVFVLGRGGGNGPIKQQRKNANSCIPKSPKNTLDSLD
jgi:hypothetical protein